MSSSRLPQQKQAAGDQDQVAGGKGGLETRQSVSIQRTREAQVEDRPRQPHQPGDSGQQDKAQNQGQADAKPPCLDLLVQR
jgi:hypothetical protein